jgi:energy-coupling factor transporter ATP-binding protein EcfA2
MMNLGSLFDEDSKEESKSNSKPKDEHVLMLDESRASILDNSTVFNLVLPVVKRDWLELKDSLYQRNIKIPQLQATFGSLAGDSAIKTELNILANTCLFEEKTGKLIQHNEHSKELSWVNTVAEKLADFSLLVRTTRWFPALIKIRHVATELFSNSLASDDYCNKLDALNQFNSASWNDETLESLSALVEPIKAEMQQFSLQQMNFLTQLPQSQTLFMWLIQHNDTAEFNRLLQVVRPCTDEPRLISAIASLVHIRTLLLALLYSKPPYKDLSDFMQYFFKEVHLDGGDSDLNHLMNIQSCFEAFQQLSERQTKSPGIKCCFDIRDISVAGVFCITSHSNKNNILTLLMNNTAEPLEYLLDLRSKILMTEIPAELEEELHIAAIVKSFIDQLQLLLDIRDCISELFISGHFNYQDDYTVQFKFDCEAGADKLKAFLEELLREMKEWKEVVKQMRRKYYYLNYYTMREILHIGMLLNKTLNKQHSNKSTIQPSTAPSVPINNSKPLSTSSTSALPAMFSCSVCTFENSVNSTICAMCNTINPAYKEEEKKSSSSAVKPIILKAIELDSVSELISLFYCISATVNREKIIQILKQWPDVIEEKHVNTNQLNEPAAFLECIGIVLDRMFNVNQHNSSPQLSLISFNPVTTAVIRAINPPSSTAVNRADMLVRVKNTANELAEKSLPVFITCAAHPSDVIDIVMSVYVRRARLPEPGEIVFCSSDTSYEQIDLLFHRFLAAGAYGRGNFVYCVADIHRLNYTMQCNLLDRLKELLVHGNLDNAASLLFVSGKPKQVLLNSLSAQSIDLPSLDVESLREAYKAAMNLTGETLVYDSNIAGGGKSHAVLTNIATRQQVQSISYRRIPIRESSNASSLVNHFNCFLPTQNNAFHIDIGHIIPANINTMLFELLIIGVLKDSSSCRVYHRNKQDIFAIEIPNSTANKTANALRFCSLLPHHTVFCTATSLDFHRPVFKDSHHSLIGLPEYSELVFVTKFLRAWKEGKFLPPADANNYEDYNPYLDRDIGNEEAFNLLSEYCADNEGVCSYNSFHSFLSFMYTAFNGLNNYPIFSGVVLATTPGLENLKDSFTSLLIETSRDFTLRSVPRDNQYGYKARKNIQVKRNDKAKNQQPNARLTLQRIPSTELREAELSFPPVNSPLLLRELSDDLVDRMNSMRSWSDSTHPICLFYMSNRGEYVEGLDVLSLNPRFLDSYINNDMKAALIHNRIQLDRDWNELKSAEAIEMIRKVEGINIWGKSKDKLSADSVDTSYVVTVDNLLKMLSIQMRIKNNLPVVITGDTGCGKSSLIKQFCAIIGAPLRTLNIHGGCSDAEIIDWLNERIEESAELSSMSKLICFLDEMNTCNSAGLLKEIICDKSMNGRQLPNNIKIIAAANPYRLKKGLAAQQDKSTGLIFDQYNNNKEDHEANVGTGISDPLANLVYRVHPLPESLLDHVFDFGALHPDTERLYIKAMLKTQLAHHLTTINADNHRAQAAEPKQAENKSNFGDNPESTDFTEFIEVFAELICAAQEFIREVHQERSVVSLRDVSRVVKVYKFFAQHFAVRGGMSCTLEEFFSVAKAARVFIRQAVILSLAFCYEMRLPRELRKQLRNTVEAAWKNCQRNQRGGGIIRFQGMFLNNFPSMRCYWLELSSDTFHSVLFDAQRGFAVEMNLGVGIALNEALLENLFMLLVSILNEIPIFIVGKPGSSKSLAVNIIQSNLNGDASDNKFLRSLPAVQIFAYQCSPLSTSAGIEQAFDSARRYKEQSPNTCVIVLLDEIFLAELSPHLPLKVLHKLLDEGYNLSVVGISNWALDPAKMNRAVYLYRPAPTVQDLSNTAEGMVTSANLKGYLQALAKAYSVVYDTQLSPDFFGLRDFYATVKLLHNQVEAAAGILSAHNIMQAVQRNYGGRSPEETQQIISTFFNCLGLNSSGVRELSVVELIAQNLKSVESRHLMLLTRNNAAVSLLFDNEILNHAASEVIFGSDFPLDCSDLQIVLNIQRIKLCMAQGVTVVLIHCENLFESLYDLFNQHYTEYNNQFYVNISLGTHSKLCPIHKLFRIVVIAEKFDAYTKLAPPLLNRLEKHILERKHLIDPQATQILNKLKQFTLLIQQGVGNVRAVSEENSAVSSLRSCFIGYHAETLSSLVQSIPSYHLAQLNSFDSLVSECVSKLLWLTTPETICKLANNPIALQTLSEQFNVELLSTYFKYQTHSDLCNFLINCLADFSDSFGSMINAFTFEPISIFTSKIIEQHTKYKAITIVSLHELSSERDLISKINDFLDSAVEGSIFILQADPLAASNRRIQHSKYILENARAKFINKKQENNKFQYNNYTATESDRQDKNKAKLINSSSGTEDSESSGVAGIHITLLTHLSRSDVDNGLLFDFDRRWKSVFIDCIEPCRSVGLPNIEAILGHSISEIIATIDMQQVLLRNFRFSLGKLVYLYERNNETVRQQILTILNALNNNEQFIDCVKATISNILKDSNIDLLAAAQQNSELILSATFNAAVHRQIELTVAKYFTILLAHADRNDGLLLLPAENNSLAKLWLYLFNRSVHDMNIINLNINFIQSANSSSNSRIDVLQDGYEHRHFQAKFPFSFYLNQLFNSLKSTLGKHNAESSVEALKQQFALLNFEHGLNEAFDEELLKCYIYDYSCINCYNSESYSKETQANIVWRLIQLVTKNFTKTANSLAAIHAAAWLVESVVDLYSLLLHNVPTIQQAVLHYLNSFQGAYNIPALHLAVLNLAINALHPSAQQWKNEVSYKNWLNQIEAVQPTLAALFTAIHADNELYEDTLNRYNKLLFDYNFIRSISYPLSVSIEFTRACLSSISAANLISAATLLNLISSLNKLAADYNNLSELNECEICEQFAAELTRYCGECRRSVCRPCVERYLSSAAYKSTKACFYCRKTDKASSFAIEKINKLGGESNKELLLQQVAARFFDWFIFQSCLGTSSNSGHNQFNKRSSKNSTKLDQELIKQFLNILAHERANHSINILPSFSSRSALLAQLLELEDSKDIVNSLLCEQLTSSLAKSNLLDTELTVTCVDVYEKRYKSSLTTAAAVTKQLECIDTNNLFNNLYNMSLLKQNESSILLILQQVALIRHAIDLFSRSLISSMEQPNEEKALLQQVEGHLSVYFSPSPKHPVSVHHSLRMYLLKLLERRKGLSFVRAVLLSEPVYSSAWFNSWLKSGEIGLTRFLGSNNLPRNNPFIQLNYWHELHTATSAVLLPNVNNCNTLDAAIKQLITNDHNKCLVKGTLLAVLFHEAYLLKILPNIPATTINRLIDLSNYIQTSPTLNFCESWERNLLLIFSGKEIKLQANNSYLAAAFDLIRLNKNSRPEEILLVRFIVHIAVLALSDVGGFAWLGQVVKDFTVFSNTYWPMMVEDVQAMTIRILGGRWYKCPNGHAYYVDQCGRPTVIQKCSTCQAEIGGLDHNLLANNSDLDSKLQGNKEYSQKSSVEDKSELNYCLRHCTEETKEMFESVRGIPPIYNRFIRLSLHSALILNSVSHYNDYDKNNYSARVNRIMNNSYTGNIKDPVAFFIGHIHSDSKLLQSFLKRNEDQVNLLLHRALNNIYDKQKSAKNSAVKGLTTLEQRSAWENEMIQVTKSALAPNNLDNELDSISHLYSNEMQEESAQFQSELLDRYDINSMAVNVRNILHPALFLYRKEFSLEEFTMELNVLNNNQSKYPLLNYFLTNQQQLYALRYLPQLLKWQSLLFNKYSNNITSTQASELRVEDILQQVTYNPEWVSAFEGYRNAWNSSWQLIERYGCMQIPTIYKNIQHDTSTAIAFSLVNEKNEGICPLVLTRYLAETHNTLLERIDELLLMRGQVNQSKLNHNLKHPVIASKYFTSYHAFNYDLQGEFLPFLSKHCVHYDSNGRIHYDMKLAEDYLFEMYCSAKPIIELQLSIIQYTDQYDGNNANQLLKHKLHQTPLNKEEADNILKEITNPNHAQSILQLLDTIIALLQSTGGSIIQHFDSKVAEMALGTYVEQVLLLNPQQAFSSNSIAKNVQLKHIQALYELLQGLLVVDIFANVHKKYRAKLEQKAIEAVRAEIQHLDLIILLPAYKDFILTQLTEEHIAVNSSIISTIGYLDHDSNYLNDFPWFNQHFPANLTMSYSLHLYQILANLS